MDFYAIQLELMLALLGVAALLADAFCPRMDPRRFGALLAAAVAGILVYSFWLTPAVTPACSGMIRNDAFALFLMRLFLLVAVLVLVLVRHDFEVLRRDAAAFYAMVLFAASGMMLMAASNDLFMVFVALELVTVSFYVLTSFLRGSEASLEAGVKYLTLGTLASSFLVFGIAFVFGSSGATNFDVLAALPAAAKQNDVLFLFGGMLILAGLGFKIACVPFQMWAPDVYQGAPTPAAAFLATGSKAAGIAVLMRMFLSGVLPMKDQWAALVVLAAAASMLYGSLGAIAQSDLKRLMGYSSIAHAGFLLMGLGACNDLGFGAVLYYLVQYAVTVLCAFLVFLAVHQATGSWDMARLAGLHKRSPLLALALFVAMMSLAGIPPLSGALGKFFLFGAALQRGAADWHFIALAGAAVVAVVISLYYYLRVVRAAYVDSLPEDSSPIPLTWALRVTLVACVVAIVLLGLWPRPLLHAALEAVKTLAGH